jgi:hypothetical protein
MADPISLSAPRIQPVVSAVPAEPADTKTFLDRCNEELNPAVASAFERQRFWWNTASTVTLVAFTSFAVGTFFATGIFAPVYVPIAGLCTLLFLEPISRIAQKFQDYAKNAQAQADQLKEINRNLQVLNQTHPVQLQIQLPHMGITWLPNAAQNPNELNAVKPLIARHQFWQSHIAKLFERKQTVLQEAQNLINESYPNNRKEIYELRATALEIDRQILESKLKNAFTIAALRRPTLRGTLESIGEISSLSMQERVVGNALGDATVNTFFTFRNRAGATLTVDQMKQTSPADLSLMLLAASN